MKDSSIEIASLVRGEVVAVRHLSSRRERAEIAAAAVAVTAGLLALMGLASVVVARAHHVVFAPLFLAGWLGAAGAAAFIAARWARARARRYRVGFDVDEVDAFAAMQMDLVRRAGDGYEVCLVPGMTGTFENGRSPLPVEALTQAGPVRLTLPPSGRATVVFGPTTFVVRWTSEEAVPSKLTWRSVARPALWAAAGAAVVTVLAAVPAARAMNESDMRSSIPKDATPWETEKLLRIHAQFQSRSLHRCFDPLPMECQRPGFVGIGMDLAKDGSIKSTWISRSTYGGECDVDACMAEVAATWFFDEMPEAMRVVMPVQVLRTGRQLLTVTPVEPDRARAGDDR